MHRNAVHHDCWRAPAFWQGAISRINQSRSSVRLKEQFGRRARYGQYGHGLHVQKWTSPTGCNSLAWNALADVAQQLR